MTIVRRCDVCGRTTDDYDDMEDNRSWGSITYTYDTLNPGPCYQDLCPQCVDKVREMVRSLADACDPTKEEPERKDSGKMTFDDAKDNYNLPRLMNRPPLIRRKAWPNRQFLAWNERENLFMKVRYCHSKILTEEDELADDWEVIA